MADIGDLLVESIFEKKNYIKIVFRYPIIFDHAKIVDILTRKKSQPTYLKNVTLDRVTSAIGGYDTGYGFQYTVWGIGNPDAGRRIYHNGSKYPIRLNSEELISELSFSFLEKDIKFRMRFFGNLAEIRPKPPLSVIKELISLLKEALAPNPQIFLSSAKEKLRSAKVDFLRGRYRSVVHNLYYTMFNVIKSLQAKEGKQRFLKHRKVSETLERILGEIQRGTSTLEVLERTQFEKINLDEYLSIVEEARAMRELADYGVGFEAGGSEEQLAEMLSKAEELVTISDYIVNGWISVENGKMILHSEEEEEFPLPSDLLNRVGLEEDLLMEGLLVLTDEFNATIFAYHLLAENDVYFSKFPWSFFRGEDYARYENGCYSHQHSPEKGFIKLSRKTVKKWSAIIKPHKLDYLGACKENVTQRLCLFFSDCFLEMYAFRDGRLYLFSPLDESGFHLQLKAFRKMERIIKKIVSKNWPSYSILFSTIEILGKRKCARIGFGKDKERRA